MLRCEHIRSSRSQGTGRITLERSEKIDALSLEMIREMAAILTDWGHDPSVRLVLLDGAGSRGFCAGGDVRAVQGFAHASDAARKFGAVSWPNARPLVARSGSSSAVREARMLTSLEDCFRLEFRLVGRLVSEHDFAEGVRAALIDKDRNPHWKPAQLSAVTDAVVDAYFTSLGPDELQL